MMNYIVNSDFLACFKACNQDLQEVHRRYRAKDGRSLTDIGISTLQLMQDSSAMFGAIVSISQGKYATAVIEKYEADANGIGAYIDLIGKYRIPSTVTTDNATDKLNTPFTSNFPGGLQQYLLDFEEAYALLDKVEKETAASEGRVPHLVPEHACVQQLRSRLSILKNYVP